MREEIRAEVESIDPLDNLEAKTKAEVLFWIDSGVELCRLEKPGTPDKHLVSYFTVIDGDYLLLVDHINAQLWLPDGGSIIDIGCGFGRDMAFFESNGFQVHGIDGSSAMLTEARNSKFVMLIRSAQLFNTLGDYEP